MKQMYEWVGTTGRTGVGQDREVGAEKLLQAYEQTTRPDDTKKDFEKVTRGLAGGGVDAREGVGAHKTKDMLTTRTRTRA